MTMRKYKSGPLEAIHSAVEGMYRSGTIDKATMRRFDKACLIRSPKFETCDIDKSKESNDTSDALLDSDSTNSDKSQQRCYANKTNLIDALSPPGI